MSGSDCAALYRLTGAVAGLPNAADDLRRRTVFGVGHVRLGTVSAALVDEPERRPRFVVVGSGGWPGSAGATARCPSTGSSARRSPTSFSTSPVTSSPTAPPTLRTGSPTGTTSRIYRYYDRTPCWASGYVFPDFNR